jgi:hypothetical protein
MEGHFAQNPGGGTMSETGMFQQEVAAFMAAVAELAFLSSSPPRRIRETHQNLAGCLLLQAASKSRSKEPNLLATPIASLLSVFREGRPLPH